MNFAQMLTYCQLKGMVSEPTIISSNPVCDTDSLHAIMSVKISNDSFKHATVMYRRESDKVALIYADILFTGCVFHSATVKSIPSRVFIKNARLSNLIDHFIK